MKRKAYLLSCDEKSERSLFSQNILKNIGFDVIVVGCIPGESLVVSNKLGMLHIYDLISNGEDEWAYVFEDDINIIEPIELDEIIQYESISKNMFYLGCCRVLEHGNVVTNTQYKINNKEVYSLSQPTHARCLHAIALSKKGAKKLLLFAEDNPNIREMDIVCEQFNNNNNFPVNVVSYHLESYIAGHFGAIFQDRKKFKSEIDI